MQFKTKLGLVDIPNDDVIKAAFEIVSEPSNEPINKYAQRAVDALKLVMGDDAARARNAFRGMTPEQMKVQHGASGETRAEILRDYEVREAELTAAIVWAISAGRKTGRT
jgi:hypothetical protein